MLNKVTSSLIKKEKDRGGWEGKEKHYRKGKKFEDGANRLGNLINKDQVFSDLILLPEILASAHEVIKGDIKIGGVDLRNPLKGKGFQRLHIDWLPRRKKIDNYIGVVCFIFLDNANKKNGPLRVIPGSHKEKYIDIPKLIQKSGTDQIKNAVPMTCNAGDVFMMNRQILHGSFANTSKERRVTINEGFFPRKRVRNITVTHLDGRVETFDDKRINERSKMIAYGINARSNFYRNEKKFNYKHLSEKIKIIDFSKNSWSFDLKDYNILDMYL